MNAPHRDAGFFTETLQSRDAELFGAIRSELGRQREEIELIASENIVSAAVLEAQGSVLTNKYAEGYPGKRYYGGCQYVDIAENLAIERAKELFGAGFANVQPNSGSQMKSPSSPVTSALAALSEKNRFVMLGSKMVVCRRSMSTKNSAPLKRNLPSR